MSQKILATRKDALVQYLPVWETSETAAGDLSGNSRNGLLINCTPAQYPGPDRSMAGLGGTNSAINLYSASQQAAFNGAEGSLRLTGIASGAGVWTDAATRYLVYINVDANNEIGIRKLSTNNTLFVRYRAGGVNKDFNITNINPTGYFDIGLSWSKAADEVRIFIDGIQQGVALTGLGTWAGVPNQFKDLIGAANTSGGSSWSGGLSHWALWSAPLTPTEFFQLSLKSDSIDPNKAYATVPQLIVTPTADGSGQTVHPSVYDAGEGQTWNGHRYWMAITGYTAGAEATENPHILCSDDKLNWAAPAGLTNPIDTPDTGFYSDTELIVDQDSVMWCAYRLASAPDVIYAKSSTDGVVLSARQTLVTGAGHPDLMSPALLWDGAQYVMYTVNALAGAGNYTLEKRTAPAVSGPWSAPVTCNMDAPLNRTDLWHIDILKAEGVYYGVINCDSAYLFFATSPDGINWRLGYNPLLASGVVGWDRSIYRATITKTTTGFDLWTSGYSGVPNVWRSGYATITY